MNYNLSFDYCALTIFALILFAHLWQRRTIELYNRLFTWLVGFGLAGTIYNIISTAGNNHIGSIPFEVTVFMNYASFIAMNACPFIYALYTQAVTRNVILNKDIRHMIRLFAPITVDTIIVLVNPWKHWIFSYTSEGVYIRGTMQIVLYVIAFYYGLYGVRTIYSKRHNVSGRMKTVLAVFFLVEVSAGIIQWFFPEMLVMFLGMALCETLILLIIQQGESAVDPGFLVFNRKAFDRIFMLNLQSNKRMGVVLLYIEEYRVLRQVIGTKEADGILTEISIFLDEIAPKKVYYLGTTTYAILLTQKEAQKMDEYMNIIRKRFCKEWDFAGNSLQIAYRTMKINVPDDIHHLDVLYYCVDSLRKTKRVEENTLLIEDVDVKRAGRKLQVEACIKRAIEEKSFEVYYQPIYSCKEKKVKSAEALIRLKDSKLGYIPPDEFIPIAERNGMIISIGDIVFEKVCQFIAAGKSVNLGVECIEVNLSVVQCMQGDLAQRIIAIMQKYKVDSSKVNLEITETAAVVTPRTLHSNMKTLHDYGVGFSLDDFGTGYSNINSMVELPLEIIKFDRSMIEMASESEAGMIALKSSAAMVKQMGMDIIAEGAETMSQVELLEQCDVDYIQGYYYSRPLPMDDFVEYLQKQK